MTARAKVIEEFAAVLSELRDGVGAPSFRTMAGRSGAISHTTLHEAVKGYRLPSWGTTGEFVKACGADPADYRQAWERASRAVSGHEPNGNERNGSERNGSERNGSERNSNERNGSERTGSERNGDGLTRNGLTGDEPAADAPALRVPVQASAEPGSATSNAGTSNAGTSSAGTPGAAGPGDPAPEDGRPAWFRRRGWVATFSGILVVLTAIAAAAVVGAWTRPDQAPSDIKASQQVPPLTPADCPRKQQNPPPAPPAHVGDRAQFVADQTLPDCTHVRRGQSVRKVWRLKNVGTVPWAGYLLRRLDPQGVRDCQTITDVQVPRTEPGAVVDIPVEVLVPHVAGFCFVRFSLMDAEGHRAFPGGRPVNFQLIVD